MYNIIIAIILAIFSFSFLVIYIPYRLILLITQVIRFISLSTLEAIKASITKTKYLKHFEFALRDHIKNMLLSFLEIIKIPLVVFKENKDDNRSLLEILKEEKELITRNWWVTVSILLFTCLSFAFYTTKIYGFIFKSSDENNIHTEDIKQSNNHTASDSVPIEKQQKSNDTSTELISKSKIDSVVSVDKPSYLKNIKVNSLNQNHSEVPSVPAYADSSKEKNKLILKYYREKQLSKFKY